MEEIDLGAWTEEGDLGGGGGVPSGFVTGLPDEEDGGGSLGAGVVELVAADGA